MEEESRSLTNISSSAAVPLVTVSDCDGEAGAQFWELPNKQPVQKKRP